MTDMRQALRVVPGETRLAAIDPRSTPGLPGKRTTGNDPKTWAREQVEAIGGELFTDQEMLFAEAKVGEDAGRRVLLVLQAMDCGGKDGTIKRVVGAMNPLGVQIVSFGAPSAEERKHDFLWRIRRALPARGNVGVFNRSHYEDVLVVRVNELVPEAVWRPRYKQINDFERKLVADGTTVVKVMLHISYDEQRERLLERLNDPTKHWKYNPGDLDARARWDDYQAAYAEALEQCSTDEAPWYVVPADRKWYRDWAVATLVQETFQEMGLHYPKATFAPKAEVARLTKDERKKNAP